jgi:hypothetical protein
MDLTSRPTDVFDLTPKTEIAALSIRAGLPVGATRKGVLAAVKDKPDPLGDTFAFSILRGRQLNIVAQSRWKPDHMFERCNDKECKTPTFSFFNRRHHCRGCGNVFCGACCKAPSGIPVRLCRSCAPAGTSRVEWVPVCYAMETPDLLDQTVRTLRAIALGDDASSTLAQAAAAEAPAPPMPRAAVNSSVDIVKPSVDGGDVPQPVTPQPTPAPADDAAVRFFRMIQSLLDTVADTNRKVDATTTAVVALRADVKVVISRLAELQQSLSSTLEAHHEGATARQNALSRAIAEMAKAASDRGAGQDAIATRVSQCYDALQLFRAELDAGFLNAEDRDGAAAEKLSTLLRTLHDKMSSDEKAQANESEAFALIDRQLRRLQTTVTRNHTVSENHLDAIARAAAASAKARDLGERDLASRLDDCRGQLAELYRAVGSGDVSAEKRDEALRLAMETLTEAIETTNSEVLAAVAIAAKEVKCFTMSLTEHRVPSVFVVAPDVPFVGGVLKSAAALLRDPLGFCKAGLFTIVRVKLVCMRTWNPVPCGEDGLGYKVTAQMAGDDSFARCLSTLMRGTLITARVFNVGASLARLFGVPAPSVPTEALKDLMDAIDAGDNTPEFVSAGGSNQQLWGERMRQFKEWLSKADPDSKWGGLERELDDESGTLRWVLPESVSAVQVDSHDDGVQSPGVGGAVVGGSAPDGSSAKGVHQGNVFVKETAAFGHPWRSRFWRVARNDDAEGGWSVHQWRRTVDGDRSPQGTPSAILSVPRRVGGVAACVHDTAFIERKQGKHRGVLKLTVTDGKNTRQINFKADMGGAANAASSHDGAKSDAEEDDLEEKWRLAFSR